MEEVMMDEAFEPLGGSCESVAATLLAMRVFGERNNWACCPVAKYLQKMGFGGARVTKGSYFTDKGRLRLRLPAHVAEFIDRFDKGDYSFLENIGRR